MRKSSLIIFPIIFLYSQFTYANPIPYVESKIQIHIVEPLLRNIEKQTSVKAKRIMLKYYSQKYIKKEALARKEGIVHLANYYSGVNTTLGNKIYILNQKKHLIKANQGLNIVCIGDSNTAGTTGFIASRRYCDLLGNIHANIDGLIAYNEGFTTLVTKDLVDRNILHVFPHKIAGKRNIVTILIGTNDFYFKNTLDTAWTQMQRLIADLKSNDWEVFVMTYPPRIRDSERNRYLRSLNLLIKHNATGIGYTVVDTYEALVDPLNEDTTKYGVLMPDLLHLTELGHYLVYKKLEAALGLKTPDVYEISLLRKKLLFPVIQKTTN